MLPLIKYFANFAAFTLLAVCIAPQDLSAETTTLRHNPIGTDHNQHDSGQASRPSRTTDLGQPSKPVPVESVNSDLQRIVVLCATQPNSPLFDQAWRSYLAKNRVVDRQLGSLIETVLREAKAYRRSNNLSPTSFGQANQTRQQMRRVAERLRHKGR